LIKHGEISVRESRSSQCRRSGMGRQRLTGSPLIVPRIVEGDQDRSQVRVTSIGCGTSVASAIMAAGETPAPQKFHFRLTDERAIAIISLYGEMTKQ
jgi:hypothetical protein